MISKFKGAEILLLPTCPAFAPFLSSFHPTVSLEICFSPLFSLIQKGVIPPPHFLLMTLKSLLFSKNNKRIRREFLHAPTTTSFKLPVLVAVGPTFPNITIYGLPFYLCKASPGLSTPPSLNSEIYLQQLSPLHQLTEILHYHPIIEKHSLGPTFSSSYFLISPSLSAMCYQCLIGKGHQ